MEAGWRTHKESNWVYNGYVWKISMIDILSRSFIRLERWGTPQSDFPYCQVLCRIDELVGEMTEKLGDSEDDNLAHACIGISTSGDFFELIMTIQAEGEVA
ncbi:MAG: hypothetical protein ACYSOO_06450 [Planctomycetota bacterium]|jgi:hypothetical protein